MGGCGLTMPSGQSDSCRRCRPRSLPITRLHPARPGPALRYNLALKPSPSNALDHNSPTPNPCHTTTFLSTDPVCPCMRAKNGAKSLTADYWPFTRWEGRGRAGGSLSCRVRG